MISNFLEKGPKKRLIFATDSSAALLGGLTKTLFQLKSKLKEFSNNVAHFAGTLESYILVKEPFKDGNYNL